MILDIAKKIKEILDNHITAKQVNVAGTTIDVEILGKEKSVEEIMDLVNVLFINVTEDYSTAEHKEEMLKWYTSLTKKNREELLMKHPEFADKVVLSFDDIRVLRETEEKGEISKRLAKEWWGGLTPEDRKEALRRNCLDENELTTEEIIWIWRVMKTKHAGLMVLAWQWYDKLSPSELLAVVTKYLGEDHDRAVTKKHVYEFYIKEFKVKVDYE